MKLTELNQLPEGILDLGHRELWRMLEGPTVIHVPGRRPEPLVVTVLAHGNEDTGWLAVRELLRMHRGRVLPRALMLFIGNIPAAREDCRHLDGQIDLNRIWADLPGAESSPERDVARQVEAIVRERRAFATIDVHNNTGHNPHYSCVCDLSPAHLHLATLFSRRVLYFRMPEGVQTMAFARICPSVTAECGLPGQPYGVEHVRAFLEACLNLAAFPERQVVPEDIDLFRSVGIVRIPPDVSFAFGHDDRAEVLFPENLDEYNFSELPSGTVLARVGSDRKIVLDVRDEGGRDVSSRFLRTENRTIRTVVPLMPSMLTCDERIVRQDCLGYLMESLDPAVLG